MHGLRSGSHPTRADVSSVIDGPCPVHGPCTSRVQTRSRWHRSKATSRAVEDSILSGARGGCACRRIILAGANRPSPCTTRARRASHALARRFFVHKVLPNCPLNSPAESKPAGKPPWGKEQTIVFSGTQCRKCPKLLVLKCLP